MSWTLSGRFLISESRQLYARTVTDAGGVGDCFTLFWVIPDGGKTKPLYCRQSGPQSLFSMCVLHVCLLRLKQKQIVIFDMHTYIWCVYTDCLRHVYNMLHKRSDGLSPKINPKSLGESPPVPA